MVEPIRRPRRLSQQIAAQLCQLIREGHYRPGDRLPAERDLAEQLQVSRASLREALRGLEIAGIVESHHGGYGQPGDWWRSSKSISGGIMYDWGVHILEYALQLIRSDIVEVTGFASSGHWSKTAKWGEDTNEDEAQAVIRFSSGVWMSLRQSSIDPVALPGMLRITGTEGTYIMGGGDWEVIKKVDGENVSEKGDNPPAEHQQYYQNVADHLVKGTELIISAEWARRPIHILDLADKSAKAGKAIAATYK